MNAADGRELALKISSSFGVASAPSGGDRGLKAFGSPCASLIIAGPRSHPWVLSPGWGYRNSTDHSLINLPP
jgi:hypothetical protein